VVLRGHNTWFIVRLIGMVSLESPGAGEIKRHPEVEMPVVTRVSRPRDLVLTEIYSFILNAPILAEVRITILEVHR
jgi:hypothetical protein